jgi:regulator of sigma E protease
MSVLLLIMGLLLFVGLVVVHEFGHFLVARRNGVEVEEFGIGFPPRAWSRRTKKGFLFSLNWLPIGGFVKLKGENDSDTRKGSMGAASTKVKAKIMLAGVGMNLLVAFILFTILGWVGMPQLLDDQYAGKTDTHVIKNEVLVGDISKGSPASKTSLKVRDKLVAIGPIGHLENISTADKLPSVTKRYAGQTVQIQYEHAGKLHTTAAKLRSPAEAAKKGALGLSPAEYTLTRSTWSAPANAIGLMEQFTLETFKGLGTAISDIFHGQGAKASQQVSGPVGIVSLLSQGSVLGYQFIFMIVAIISLTLAIMNVLPIPALDGGRLFMIVLSRIFGRKLSPEMEERIVGASFLFLLALILLITVVDVRRL